MSWKAEIKTESKYLKPGKLYAGEVRNGVHAFVKKMVTHF